MPKDRRPSTGANPERAKAAHARRSSGAAGPHASTMPRRRIERQAIEDQLDPDMADYREFQRERPAGPGRRLYDDGVRLFVVLDFDGVLNAFPDERSGRGGPAYDDFETFGQSVRDNGMRAVYPITWSPSMIAALNALLADDRAQLCWLTSWRGQVRKPAERMGLYGARPAVVVAHGSPWEESGQQGKPDGLIAFMDGVPADAGVVWCDDNLNERTRHWSTYAGWDERVRQGLEAGLLVVGPSEETGISRPEMARIEAFAAEVLSPRT